MTDDIFLLDSNICIYHLLGQPPTLAVKLRAHRGRVVTSSVCYGEVMMGIVGKGGGPDEGARSLFRQIEVLPFDRAAADSYAQLPFRRARFDRLIAAHALSVGAVLVTNNPADFADIPQLRTENWAA